MSRPTEQVQSKTQARFLEILREQCARGQELATLAARICPELCQQNPSRAIEIAQALLAEARRKIVEDGSGAVALQALMEMAMEGVVFDGGLRKAFLEETWEGETVEGLPRKVAEYLDAKLGKSRPFETSVKVITGENRLVRAMPWFRKFIGSRTPNEQACTTEIAKARKDGLTVVQLLKFKAAFDRWKPEEKSRMARTKNAKRKKKDQL